MELKKLKKISDYEWEIPPTGDMRVPGKIFADKNLLRKWMKRFMNRFVM